MDLVARRLTTRRIAVRATFLLIEYQGRFGQIQHPPVPVDEILERFLGMRLELDDIPARFGLDRVHGVTLRETRQVFIDQSLDPVEHPAMEGRFNYTIAHEIGHVCLRHPPILGFSPDERRPWLVGSYKELEWQADKFAAYLQMPKGMVLREWQAAFGHANPLVITSEMERAALANGFTREEFVKAFAEEHARGLAERFKVSAEAMRIQLQELGLLPKK